MSEIGKFACIDCDSSDALSVYEQEDGTYDATCWSVCQSDKKKGYKSHNQLCKSYLKEELGIEEIKRGKKLVVKSKLKSKLKKKDESTKVITSDKLAWIRDNSSAKGNKFRGIKDETLKLFNIRTAYDDDGTPSERFYPIYKSVDGKVTMVGCHKRIVAGKDFRAVGLNSKNCMLFGQKEAKGSKRVVLVGGQEDVAAATQMFREWSKNKDNVAPVDFVSSTVGETSCAEQCRANYDFLDSYDEILVDMDDDEAGEKACGKLLEVLPLAKVKVMKYNAKDANEALRNKLRDDYIRAIYNAKKPEVAGIHGASSILSELVSDLSFEKLPLPPFMKEINEAFNGGYDFGTFNLICGDTSCGKTTLVNTIGNHIVECGEYVPTILSLEAKKSVLTRQYLSIHLNKKLADFTSREELSDYLEENKEAINDYLTVEDGTDSFYVIDDRARLTTIDDTFKMIERAIVHLNSRVIILDVYTDLLDSLSIEEQNLFNGRIKALIANHNVCIIAICHTRKIEGKEKDGSPRLEPSRGDLWGSKMTLASCTSAIFIWRDLQNADPDERNTTYVKIDKNRDHSITGPAGRWLYCVEKSNYINRLGYDKGF